MESWIVMVLVLIELTCYTVSGQAEISVNTTATTNTSEPTGGDSCGLDYCTSCRQPAGFCTACGVGFYLQATNKCTACPVDCVSCSASGCMQCAEGMYITQTQTSCAACSTTNCKQCFSNQTCTQCKDGYYLYNNICQVCSARNCAQCKKDGVGDVCETCADGFLLVSGRRCLEVCPSHCQWCDLDLISQVIRCTQCIPRYYVKGDGTCSACQENCVECKQNDTRLVCEECSPGFYINHNYNCSACELGDLCTSCTRDPPTCDSCQDMYRLHTDPTMGCLYDPTYDCYNCEGEDCPVTVTEGDTEVTTQYCSGLNTTTSCQSSFTSSLSNNNTLMSEKSYNYSCEQTVCDNSGVQTCTYNPTTKVLICSRCCGTRICNTEIPPGISLSSTTQLGELFSQLSPSSNGTTSGTPLRASLDILLSLTIISVYLI